MKTPAADKTPRKCVAHRKSDGKPCKAFAMHGGTVCWRHGGMAPQVKAKARRRLEEAQKLKLAAAAVKRFGLAADEDIPDLDPRQVLAEEMWRTVKVVRGLEGEVAVLDAIHGPTFHATGFVTGEAKAHITWVMWQEQREHLRAVAAECHRAGIETFRLELDQRQAALVADVIRAVFDDPELGLEPRRREVAVRAAARHLRLLDSGEWQADEGR